MNTNVLDIADTTPLNFNDDDVRHNIANHHPGLKAGTSEVRNDIVWIIAFAPLIGAFIQGAAAGTWQVSLWSLWWIPIVLNSVLCLADLVQLDYNGADTEGLMTWALFLVPIYLFMRAERFRQSPTYGWVWIVMFAISLAPVIVRMPVAVYQYHPTP